MSTSKSKHRFGSFLMAAPPAQQMMSDETKCIVGGVVLVALVVAFSVWAWPEVHRTIRIHRM